MTQFDNVTIIREANLYFDGRVSSRSVIFGDGSRKTLGIMMPGDYEFATEEKELMEILSGRLAVQLPNAQWMQVGGGESFEVPAKSKFKLKIEETTDYCCSYIHETT